MYHKIIVKIFFLGTRSGQGTSLEQSLKTPRSVSTARPVTGASGRHVRLGTVGDNCSGDSVQKRRIVEGWQIQNLTKLFENVKMPNPNTCSGFGELGFRWFETFLNPESHFKT